VARVPIATENKRLRCIFPIEQKISEQSVKVHLLSDSSKSRSNSHCSSSIECYAR
jgi:hypothetical protein